MQKNYVFITYFIVENGDEENAYRTYRTRVKNLSALEGVEVVSVSQGLRQVDKGYTWESLADQYQIEHDGAYPENHVLCKVFTVVVLKDIEYYDRVTESLFMDDRDVDIDRYPSSLDAIEQLLLSEGQ